MVPHVRLVFGTPRVEFKSFKSPTVPFLGVAIGVMHTQDDEVGSWISVGVGGATHLLDKLADWYIAIISRNQVVRHLHLVKPGCHFIALTVVASEAECATPPAALGPLDILVCHSGAFGIAALVHLVRVGQGRRFGLHQLLLGSLSKGI